MKLLIRVKGKYTWKYYYSKNIAKVKQMSGREKKPIYEFNDISIHNTVQSFPELFSRWNPLGKAFFFHAARYLLSSHDFICVYCWAYMLSSPLQLVFISIYFFLCIAFSQLLCGMLDCKNCWNNCERIIKNGNRKKLIWI